MTHVSLIYWRVSNVRGFGGGTILSDRPGKTHLPLGDVDERAGPCFGVWAPGLPVSSHPMRMYK